jgi:hypothetical protein
MSRPERSSKSHNGDAASIEKPGPIFIGRWTPKILFSLKEKPYRHGELRRNIGNVSRRMLTRTLRNLESTGIDHPARDQNEGQGLRVFVDQAGKDDHRATPGYVPLGQTIQPGGERRRASSESAPERLGTRMFPFALLARAWQAEAVLSAQEGEDFRKTQQSVERKATN